MRFSENTTVTLHGRIYHIDQFVGRGAIADVYRVHLASRPEPLALKVLHDAGDEEKAAQLRYEDQVLKQLNAVEMPNWDRLTSLEDRLRRAMEANRDRVIIAGLESGELDDGRPYVIQEFAPPPVNYTPVETLQDEWRVFAVMTRVAEGIRVAHDQGMALRDFHPLEKLDRMRVAWIDDSKPLVRLIDWNITGGTDDFPRDLLYFGIFLYYLLVGKKPEEPLPRRLGMNTPTWDALQDGSRLILQRLLHPVPRKRYPTAEAVVDDMAWWTQTLAIGLKEDASRRLQERAMHARLKDRHDRLLAVASLALAGSLSQQDARTFDAFRQQALSELEKETRLAVANVRVSLRAGQFLQAIKDADRALSHLDADSEAARQVRYLRYQATLGRTWQEAGVQNPRRLPAWPLIQEVIDDLIHYRWEKAGVKLRKAGKEDATLERMPVFRTLMDVITAGRSLIYVRDLYELAQPHGPDILAPDWEAKEEEKLTKLEEAVHKLTSAMELAPQESLFRETKEAYESEWRQRRAQKEQLLRLKEAVDSHQYQQAETLLQTILREFPDNVYAKAIEPEVRRYARYMDFLQRGKDALRNGAYAKARNHFQEAAYLLPEGTEAQQLAVIARLGEQAVNRVEERIHALEQAIDEWESQDDLALAQSLHNQIQALQSLHDHPWDEVASTLTLSSRVTIGTTDGFDVFVLQSSLLEKVASLRDRMQRIIDDRVKGERTQLEEAWRACDFQTPSPARLDEDFLSLASQLEMDALREMRRRLDASRDAVDRFQAKLEALTRTQEAETRLQGLMQALEALEETNALPDAVQNDARVLLETANRYRQFVEERDGAPPDPPTMDFSCLRQPLQKARNLLHEAIVQDLRARARGAWLAHQYDQVSRWLDALDLFETLTEEESQWREDAEKALSRFQWLATRLNEAERILRETENLNAMGATKLIKDYIMPAWNRLDTVDTGDVRELRKRISDLWRLAIRKILIQDEPNALEPIDNLLSQAIEMLAPANLHRELEADHTLIEQGKHIQAFVNSLADADAGETPASRHSQGKAAEETWRSIYASDWETLRNWAQARQKDAEAFLRSRLPGWRQQAEDALIKREFDRALVLRPIVKLLSFPRWQDLESESSTLKATIERAHMLKDLQAGLDALWSQLTQRPHDLLLSDLPAWPEIKPRIQREKDALAPEAARRFEQLLFLEGVDQPLNTGVQKETMYAQTLQSILDASAQIRKVEGEADDTFRHLLEIRRKKLTTYAQQRIVLPLADQLRGLVNSDDVWDDAMIQRLAILHAQARWVVQALSGVTSSTGLTVKSLEGAVKKTAQHPLRVLLTQAAKFVEQGARSERLTEAQRAYAQARDRGRLARRWREMLSTPPNGELLPDASLISPWQNQGIPSMQRLKSLEKKLIALEENHRELEENHRDVSSPKTLSKMANTLDALYASLQGLRKTLQPFLDASTKEAMNS